MGFESERETKTARFFGRFNRIDKLAWWYGWDVDQMVAVHGYRP
jgi:hypothetical protein